MRPGPNGTIAFAFESRRAESASGASGLPGAAAASDGQPKPARRPYDEPRISTSAKMAPDPSVRGLRYGKPPKTPTPILTSTVLRAAARRTASSGSP